MSGFYKTFHEVFPQFCIAAKKPLYFAFIDLEKAFNSVPRKVIWWAMRSLGVKKWAVRIVKGMHANALSRV